MSGVNGTNESTDHCPCCLLRYEIVALKFRFLRPPLSLMACMACGLVQSEPEPVAVKTPKRQEQIRRPALDTALRDNL
jgi:hypothetical protein